MQKLIFLQILSLVIHTSSYCQNNQWLLGTWMGTHKNNGVFKNSITILKITKIDGSLFEGVSENVVFKDSSFNAQSYITGELHKNYLTIKLGNTIYEKKFLANSGIFWRDCRTCAPVKYKWKKKKDIIILNGERNCEPNCSGIFEFSKKIETLVSSTLFKPDSLKLKKDEQVTILPQDTLHSTISYITRPTEKVARYSVTNADSAEIRLFDDGVIDGDEVTLLYNGKILVSKLILKASAYSIKIPIVKGQVNTFVLYAENLGTIPPNTAFLRILFDGKEVALNLSSDFIKSGAIEFVRSGTIEL